MCSNGIRYVYCFPESPNETNQTENSEIRTYSNIWTRTVIFFLGYFPPKTELRLLIQTIPGPGIVCRPLSPQRLLCHHSVNTWNPICSQSRFHHDDDFLLADFTRCDCKVSLQFSTLCHFNHFFLHYIYITLPYLAMLTSTTTPQQYPITATLIAQPDNTVTA